MRKNMLLLTSLLLIGLPVVACTPAPVDEDALRTEAAATIYAKLTAKAPVVTDTASPTATPTLQAKDTPTPTSVVIPTRSPIPTPTATPSRTPALTPTLGSTITATPSPCLLDASFDEDVTVPDDTSFAPSETFTKTWRLRSDGCAPWLTGSTLVFESGDQMGAPESIPVPDTSLSDTADISVQMVAPDKPGTYKSFWQLQTPSGDRFGSRVWVTIVVQGPIPSP